MLLLGDSITEGYSVEEPYTLRSVLEALLNSRREGRFEVINGGTAGYSTDQEYLFYRDEGVSYAPRVVVLLFYYNDVLYNARAAVPEWDGQELRMALEEDALLWDGTPRWLDGRQTKLHLIG